jgi:hypothetical protein
VSVNDSKIKSYCLFPQSFSSVKIQIFLFCSDFRHPQFLDMGKVEVITSKIYGRHHDLVDRYGISVSQMTTDMFDLS